MIHQDLAAKILNVLFTAAENSTFSGDEADRDEVLSNPKLVNDPDWAIKIPCYSYTITKYDMPVTLGTDYNSAPVLSYESYVDKMPESDKGLTGDRALTAIYNYVTQKIFINDQCVRNTEIDYIEQRMAFDKVETSYNPELIKEPVCPIGYASESLDQLYRKIEEHPWQTTSEEELKNHLNQKFIAVLGNVFSKFKNKILQDSQYYGTSSALQIVQKRDYGGGDIKYEPQSRKLSKLNYTVYTTSTQTGYITVDAPPDKNADFGYRRTRTFQIKRTVVDVETKELTEENAANFINAYTLRYYAQAAAATSMAYYPDKAYIGLFTNLKSGNDGNTTNGMPKVDGTGFREPPYKDYSDESNPSSYQRMNLHRGLFSDEGVFNEIQLTTDEDKYKEHEGCALLENKEIIMFPEVLNPEGWGNISGFGIFENPVAEEGEAPFFWGEVTTVPADEGTVPLFRPEEFRIYLG